VCRGCGARGSVIDLIAFLDRCTIHEAVAKLCGNPPPARPLSNPQRVSRTPADCDGTDRALQWWAEARSIAGTLAEDYLVQHRGIGTFPPDVDDVLLPSLAVFFAVGRDLGDLRVGRALDDRGDYSALVDAAVAPLVGFASGRDHLRQGLRYCGVLSYC
jgi:hypothetical protein